MRGHFHCWGCCGVVGVLPEPVPDDPKPPELPTPPLLPNPEPELEPKPVPDVPGVVVPGEVPLVPLTFDVPPPKRLTELSRSSIGS